MGFHGDIIWYDGIHKRLYSWFTNDLTVYGRYIKTYDYGMHLALETIVHINVWPTNCTFFPDVTCVREGILGAPSSYGYSMDINSLKNVIGLGRQSPFCASNFSVSGCVGVSQIHWSLSSDELILKATIFFLVSPWSIPGRGSMAINVLESLKAYHPVPCALEADCLPRPACRLGSSTGKRQTATLPNPFLSVRAAQSEALFVRKFVRSCATELRRHFW